MKLYSKFNLNFIQSSHPKYKNVCYMIQNLSCVTLFTVCEQKCLMNILTKFYLPTVFLSGAMDLSKCVLQVTKSLEHDNIYRCLK